MQSQESPISIQDEAKISPDVTATNLSPEMSEHPNQAIIDQYIARYRHRPHDSYMLHLAKCEQEGE